MVGKCQESGERSGGRGEAEEELRRVRSDPVQSLLFPTHIRRVMT